MSQFVERIIKLSEEIESFPLGNCSPSDDPDMQTAYLYAFRNLVKRFIASAKRIDEETIAKMIEVIDTNPEFITDAYDLKAELQGVIDYIKDSKSGLNQKIKEKPEITVASAKELSAIIQENLAKESANNLPRICSGYGLAEGTVSDAFKSKNDYVHSRISHLSAQAILDLSNKMKGKYPESRLDDYIDKISENDNLGLISEFDNIQAVLKREINDAKFLIWIAVAWFTDNDLAEILYLKYKEGLNIQIVLNDDKINSSMIEKLSKNFEIHLASSNDRSAILMHNKFCIIDLEKVIHGSYNWTNRAKYNNETITLIKSRINAEKFAKEFIKLKTELKNINAQ